MIGADRDLAPDCPSCGRPLNGRATVPSLQIGTVLALVGGVALVTAFWMPWFSSQGLLLSGSFLARFLGSPADVQRFMPALAGNPSEVQLLRGLVYLFPTCGLIAIVLALLHGAWSAGRRLVGILLAVSGLVPLVALAIGLTRLPPGAAPEIGLWQLGIGAAAILIGPILNVVLARR
jgi:hypothetical protein